MRASFPKTAHLSGNHTSFQNAHHFKRPGIFQNLHHFKRPRLFPKHLEGHAPSWPCAQVLTDATERVPPLGWSHCRSQYRKDTRATLRRGRVPKCLRTRQSASLQQRHLVAAAVRFGRELMAIVRRSSSCFRSAVQGGRVLPRLARQISCFLAASTISPRMKSGGSLALN